MISFSNLFENNDDENSKTGLDAKSVQNIISSNRQNSESGGSSGGKKNNNMPSLSSMYSSKNTTSSVPPPSSAEKVSKITSAYTPKPSRGFSNSNPTAAHI